jgi:hypothetical protein
MLKIFHYMVSRRGGHWCRKRKRKRRRGRGRGRDVC